MLSSSQPAECGTHNIEEWQTFLQQCDTKSGCARLQMPQNAVAGVRGISAQELVSAHDGFTNHTQCWMRCLHTSAARFKILFLSYTSQYPANI